jgi:hypothetical protein
MGLVKTLDIPTYILNFFNLQENLELLEYIIAGIFGLVSRLGFKGLIEGIFLDNYATMGGEDPIQGSISGSKPGGVGGSGSGNVSGSTSGRTSDTSGNNLPEKGKQIEGSGSGDKKLESSPENVSKTEKEGESSLGVDTPQQEGGQSSSENYIPGKHRAQRFTSIYGNLAKHLSEEMEVLSVSMNEAKSDDE